jgi:hypothetical protein
MAHMHFPHGASPSRGETILCFRLVDPFCALSLRLILLLLSFIAKFLTLPSAILFSSMIWAESGDQPGQTV